jgi:hypothetical protein
LEKVLDGLLMESTLSAVKLTVDNMVVSSLTTRAIPSGGLTPGESPATVSADIDLSVFSGMHVEVCLVATSLTDETECCLQVQLE